MNEYLKLAEQLETFSPNKYDSLEKIASLCLLYEYFNRGDDLNLFSSPTLVKAASNMLNEEAVALELGVKLGINALFGKGDLNE